MSVFSEITILVAVAVAIAFVMRALRQPLMVGYILTGLLVGPVFLNLVHSEETLALFSEIGVAFLLFIVGLNLTPVAVKRFGKVSLLTGLGQVIFTFIVGWLIAVALGFSSIAAAYLSIGLAFSSTIIILKLLSDKGDLDRLYGRISIGFLLVQDFIAVTILFFIPVLTGDHTASEIVVKLVIGFLSLVLVFLLSHHLLPKINQFVSRSQELLFLFAIAWGLGFAGLFQALGFSLESGALIAGATLSILPSHDEIHARLKPLRDFFIILFFIFLGAKLVLTGASSMLVPAIVFSVFVLLASPIIMMVIMGLMGYRKRTGFQTGLTVAQISEFSLIIVGLGVAQGHIGGEILTLMTVVGIFTIFVSSYLIMNSDWLYQKFAPILGIFEKKEITEQAYTPKKFTSVLFGYNRIGYDFLQTLDRMRQDTLVVDYDPEVVSELTRKKQPVLYGDASDLEFLRMINLDKAKLAISTIPNSYANRLILQEVRRQNPKTVVIGMAHNISEAMELYEHGMDYVVMPHFLGGHAASKMVEELGFVRGKYDRVRKHHIDYLLKRREAGHEHPTVDRV